MNISKLLRNIAGAVLMVAVAVAATGCHKKLQHGNTMLDPAAYDLKFQDGVWDGVNSNQPLVLGNMTFSHSVGHSDSGLVWYGFTPAKRYDVRRYEDWTGEMLNAMVSNYLGGTYIAAHWDASEPTDRVPATPSLSLRRADHTPFSPTDIYIGTTAYFHYTVQPIMNGTHYCKVVMIGLQNGEEIARQDIYLVRNGQMVSDLTLTSNALGKNGWYVAYSDEFESVDTVYFQMETNLPGGFDAVPPYFIVGSLVYSLG